MNKGFDIFMSNYKSTVSFLIVIYFCTFFVLSKVYDFSVLTNYIVCFVAFVIVVILRYLERKKKK